MNALRRDLGKVGTSRKDCDINRATLRLLRTTPIKVTFEEVTGHLNEVVSYEYLTQMEQLNVDCDTLAGRYLAQAVAGGEESIQYLPSKGLFCYI